MRKRGFRGVYFFEMDFLDIVVSVVVLFLTLCVYYLLRRISTASETLRATELELKALKHHVEVAEEVSSGWWLKGSGEGQKDDSDVTLSWGVVCRWFLLDDFRVQFDTQVVRRTFC